MLVMTQLDRGKALKGTAKLSCRYPSDRPEMDCSGRKTEPHLSNELMTDKLAVAWHVLRDLSVPPDPADGTQASAERWRCNGHLRHLPP